MIIEDAILAKTSNIKLLALDVDGILSDGKIIYDANETETKSFYVQDGVGIKAIQKFGVTVAIITGRNSPMVTKRAKELGIEYVIQGRDDKLQALKELIASLSLDLEQCAYMGDDLPDIKAIQAVCFGVSVPNGHVEVTNRADYVTNKFGGHGAVREVCDLILKGLGCYDTFVSIYID